MEGVVLCGGGGGGKGGRGGRWWERRVEVREEEGV